MKDARDIIIRPIITEHSYDMIEMNTSLRRSAFASSRVTPAAGRRPWSPSPKARPSRSSPANRWKTQAERALFGAPFLLSN